jgi:two-component system, OmpR family, sensor kinase
VQRIPIRIRLTVAFTAVMAVVLTATGLFLYLRLRADVDQTVEQGLRSRAGDIAALVQQEGSGLAAARSRVADQGSGFAQVLDARGRIVDATPQVRRRALLSAAELRRGQGRTLLIDRGPLPGLDRASRLLATPVSAGDRRLVVVVGASLEDRDQALASLRTLLLIGGPIALLLASLAGYGLAAAALRPVERMRARAAAISAEEPGQRLPVTPAQDEVGRLGRTLNEMLARLEAALARERTFVADAGHELRSPLAILRTELELAVGRGRSAEELEAALVSAAEETDRLAQLAEDLLVIARSDQGRLPVRLATVNAGELLTGVRERFRQRADERGRAIEVEARDGVSFQADPRRVEQALGNLVDNALRYGAGRVRLAATERDWMVTLHVTDEGSGFSRDFLDSAFERFTRADTARGRGGAGLGLAIVAAIAEAHHGTAGAENRAAGGADVWIAVPAQGRS